MPQLFGNSYLVPGYPFPGAVNPVQNNGTCGACSRAYVSIVRIRLQHRVLDAHTTMHSWRILGREGISWKRELLDTCNSQDVTRIASSLSRQTRRHRQLLHVTDDGSRSMLCLKQWWSLRLADKELSWRPHDNEKGQGKKIKGFENVGFMFCGFQVCCATGAWFFRGFGFQRCECIEAYPAIGSDANVNEWNVSGQVGYKLFVGKMTVVRKNEVMYRYDVVRGHR